VAAKPETAVAYIVLARDVFRDIQDQFGGRHVRMPIESDFVNEAVSVVKRDLSRSSSTIQGSPQRDSTWPSISCQSRNMDTITNRRAILRPIELIRRNMQKTPALDVANSTANIEIRRKSSVCEVQIVKQLT
jgi:hypothetical protein